MVNVKLSSSDDDVFEVPIEVAKMSKTISNLFTDLGLDDDTVDEAQNREPIPLPNVKGTILKKVLKWCTQHKGEPAPEEPTTGDLHPWDLKYMNVPKQQIFEIILAANYLDIGGLIDVACLHVANLMKGKSTTEIRTEFNIANDLNPEEQKVILKESAWCED